MAKRSGCTLICFAIIAASCSRADEAVESEPTTNNMTGPDWSDPAVVMEATNSTVIGKAIPDTSKTSSKPSSGVSSNGMPTTTRTMNFDTCVRQIQAYAGSIGVAPINIVETSDVRIVRFPATDGSVLLTCSRPDRKMILVQSPHR